MRRGVIVIITVATVGVLLGALIAVDNVPARFGIAAVVFVGLAIAAAPIREWALLGWVCLAPYWQEAARGSQIGTALNNGAYLIAGGGLVVWAAFLALYRVRTGRSRAIEVVALILCVYAIASLSVNELFPLGWTRADFTRQLYANVLLPVAGYYVIAYGVGRDFLARLFMAIWVSSLGVSALTILEKLTGWQLWGDTKWQMVDIGRSVGPLANPAVLGTFLGFTIASAAAYLMWSGTETLRVRVALASLVLAIPALWFTYARASLLAVAVVITLMAALKSKYRVALAGSVFVALIALALAWGTIGDSPVISERIGNVSNVQARVLLTAWSVELAVQRPIWGWGYGSFDAATGSAHGAIAEIPTTYAAGDTSHNTFLTFVVELGLAGALLLLILWVPTTVKAARILSSHRSTDWLLFAGLGIVTVFAVNAVFIDMRFFSLPAMLAWMALGAMRNVMAADPFRDPETPVLAAQQEGA